MDNERIKYTTSQALLVGIWFTIGFTFFDLFVDRKPVVIVKIIFHFIFFTIAYFFWGYFGYKSYLKRLKEKDKILSPKQFRCFKCENIIQLDESKCSRCGWTWNK